VDESATGSVNSFPVPTRPALNDQR